MNEKNLKKNDIINSKFKENPVKKKINSINLNTETNKKKQNPKMKAIKLRLNKIHRIDLL